MRIALIFIMVLIATYSEAQIWDNYMKAINEINSRPTSPTMFNSGRSYNNYNSGNIIIKNEAPVVIQQQFNTIQQSSSIVELRRRLDIIEREAKINLEKIERLK